MAYTYDDFTRAANNAGLMDSFPQEDLDVAKSNPEYGLGLVKLAQDYQSATTAEQKLLVQESINQLKKSYGLSTIGSFSNETGSSALPEYSYSGQSEYDKLLNKVTSREPFSYDTENDPMYSAYKKEYLREADRATQDTLAQASAMSGGKPSSYAVNAAQQAGNYYRGQLSDVVPTLQQNAFQRYLSEYSNDLSALEAVSADREFDFNAYLQEYTKKQQEWDNALTLFNLGIDTAEIRQILGIPTATESSGSSGSSDSSEKSGSSGGSGGAGGSGDNSDVQVDMNSVLNLGYGPISSSTLAGLVNAGAVNATSDGKKITVSKNEKTTNEKTTNLNPAFGALFKNN